jgi:hypothetical protein
MHCNCTSCTALTSGVLSQSDVCSVIGGNLANPPIKSIVNDVGATFHTFPILQYNADTFARNSI